MHSATGNISFGDPGVDRHHLIIRNTQSIFPSSWSHALLPSFVDPRNLCGSSWPRIPSYSFTSFLPSPSQNRSFSWIPCGYHARCGGVLLMGCLPSSSTVAPHHDRVNLEMHSEAVIERVWRYTWRPSSSEFGDSFWWPWWCELGSRNRASLEIHLEAVIQRV